MKVLIRPESHKDYAAIKAISDLVFGHNKEGILIEKLRKMPDFIPDLSLVADSEGTVAGYILLYPVKINDGVIRHDTLSLAPMCVHPAYQRNGIGKKLVREGMRRSRDAGYRSIIVLGHPDYYPRFGFKRASSFGIRTPFKVTENIFLAIELVVGGLKNIRGIVEYPEPFSAAI